MCEALLLENDFVKRIIIEKNVLQWQYAILPCRRNLSVVLIARRLNLNVFEGVPTGGNYNDRM